MSARPPWWTEADASELDVALWEFVRAARAHTGCLRCRARNHYCKPLEEAFEAILEWKRGRELFSRAEWLRERQNERAAA